MAVTLILISFLVYLQCSICHPVVPSPPNVDINNPSYSDPINPPKSISFPDKVPPNPFPSGIPSQPNQCEGLNPSDDCLHGMVASGGYLFFDKDSKCSQPQKDAAQTAIWDASTLANYANPVPDSGEANHGEGSADFYMGPDFRSQQSRISGNLKRVADFKSGRTSKKAYITVSCNDKDKLCPTKIPGSPQKGVGGYAWTYSGWWGYYHYITLCPTFFTMDTLATKLNQVEQDLAKGSTKMAKDMDWLKSSGQLFLHEMMHTRIADGGYEPHINDEYIRDKPPDRRRIDFENKAYGPRNVAKLASNPIGRGGGATRASTNADSYAMLANAIWWWDTTGYFPGIPDKTKSTMAADNPEVLPVFLNVDLNDKSPKDADFATLFADASKDFEGDFTKDEEPPQPDIPPPETPPPAPAPPVPAAKEMCGTWYRVLFDHFQIYGKDFDAAKFGEDGEGLKKEISGCGKLTKWRFEPKTGDPQGFQWKATGNLPIGTKSCVGAAIRSAGGGSDGGCKGAG